MKLTIQNEKKIYSQNGQDGITLAILDLIGTTNKVAVEIAAGDGGECNTHVLSAQCGFKCLQFDERYGGKNGVIKQRITRDNLSDTLNVFGCPATPDVLGLDVDGIDWWLLSELGQYVPRLLICEYNNGLGRDCCSTIPYDPNFSWAGTSYYGASAVAMHRLANSLGMALVYVESSGTDMFFVNKTNAHLFDDADDAEALYCRHVWSHPPDPRMGQMINPF